MLHKSLPVNPARTTAEDYYRYRFAERFTECCDIQHIHEFLAKQRILRRNFTTRVPDSSIHVARADEVIE